MLYRLLAYEQGQGLCVVTAIIRGKLEEMAVQAAAERVTCSLHACIIESWTYQTSKCGESHLAETLSYLLQSENHCCISPLDYRL